jgi:hypothetical protein
MGDVVFTSGQKRWSIRSDRMDRTVSEIALRTVLFLTMIKSISQIVYGQYGFDGSNCWYIYLGNKHPLLETTYCVYELIRIVTRVYGPNEFDGS